MVFEGSSQTVLEKRGEREFLTRSLLSAVNAPAGFGDVEFDESVN